MYRQIDTLPALSQSWRAQGHIVFDTTISIFIKWLFIKEITNSKDERPVFYLQQNRCTLSNQNIIATINVLIGKSTPPCFVGVVTYIGFVNIPVVKDLQ